MGKRIIARVLLVCFIAGSLPVECLADTLASENFSSIIEGVVDKVASEGAVDALSSGGSLEITEDEIISGAYASGSFDESISSSAVEKAKDKSVSAAAVETELSKGSLSLLEMCKIKTEKFTSGVVELLEGDYYYDALCYTDKVILNRHLFVREDTMEKCCEKGLNIMQSIPVALIMQRLAVEYSDAIAIINGYGSLEMALDESLNLRMKEYDYYFITDEFRERCVQYMKQGVATESIYNAYAVGYAIGEDFEEIISEMENISENEKEDIEEADSIKMNMEAEEKVEIITEAEADVRNSDSIYEAAELLSVKEEAIEEYLSESDYSAEQLYYDIYQAKVELGMIAVEQTTRDEDEDINFSPYLGPFSYEDGRFDRVNLNTGNVIYDDTVFSFIEAGNINFDLNMRYTSNSGKAEEGIAYNWEMNIPALYNPYGEGIARSDASGYTQQEKSLKYIKLDSGIMYTVSKIGTTDGVVSYEVNDCYEKISITRDTNSSLGVYSRYIVTYENGNIDTFDFSGSWLGRSDIFGNELTFSGSYVPEGDISYWTEELTLRSNDADLQTVTIKYGNVTDCDNISTTGVIVTFPDETTKEYAKKVISCSSSKTLTTIRSIKQQNGKFIKFDYTGVYDSDRDLRNANLTQITYPTGMTINYAYSSADYYSSNGIVIGRFYRVSSRNIQYGSRTYMATSYSYDGNYTLNEANTTNNYKTIATTSKDITTYEYNKYNNCLVQTIADTSGAVLKKIETTYDSSKPEKPYPERIKTTIGSRVAIELFDYDDYGKLKRYCSPLSGGTYVNKYTTTYTYNADFGLLTAKEYYLDDNTHIKEIYDLNGEGRFPYENCVTVRYSAYNYNSIYENYPLKREEYLYDSLKRLVQTTYYCGVAGTPGSSSHYNRNNHSGNLHLPSQITNGLEAVNYTYDNMGRVLSESVVNVNPPEDEPQEVNNTISYSYDDMGNVISKSKYNHQIETTSYDYVNNIIVVTTPEERKSKYYYDPAGNFIRQENRSGQIIKQYTYDNFMRVNSSRENNSAPTTYTYDALDRVLSEIVTVNGAELKNKGYVYSSNANSLIVTSTVYNNDVLYVQTPVYHNITTRKVYDVMDRLITETLDPYSTKPYTNSYEYDIVGNVVKHTDDELVKEYTYDIFGNVLTEKVGSVMMKSCTYDIGGRILTETNANNATTQYSYYSYNKLKSVTVPIDASNNSITEYTYDTNGRCIKTTLTNSAPGQSETYRVSGLEYDLLNDWEWDYVLNDSGEKVYTEKRYYNADGDLTQTVYPNNTSISYSYDPVGRLSKITDQLGNEESYTYNANQQIATRTDRNGDITSYVYDGLNRILQESIVKSGTTYSKNYTYNLAGDLCKIDTNDGDQMTYRYDSKGYRTYEYMNINGTQYNIFRSYLEDGRLQYYEVAKGSEIYTYYHQYGYDDLNRLSYVKKSNDSSSTVSYTYDNCGNVTQISYPNGITQARTYNKANLVTGVSTVKNGASVFNESYTYNRDLTVQSKNSNFVETSYTYDRLGRLVSEHQVDDYDNEIENSYTYDVVGNRVEWINNDSEGDEVKTTYTYDANNRLISSSEAINIANPLLRTNTVYTYEDNGNLIGKSVSVYNSNSGSSGNITSLSRSYTFDGFNQLVSVKNGANADIAQYSYYPDGLRRSKTVNGTTENYINQDGNAVAIVDANGNITAGYLYGLSREARFEDDEYTFFVSDGQGSIVLRYDSDGNTITDTASYYRYDAYGKDITGGSSQNPFRYRGEFCDNETDLIYLRGRYYDPTTGRFISEDPAKDGFNWYAYCANDPVNFIDPSGLIITQAEIDMKNNGKMAPGAYSFLMLCTYNIYLADTDFDRQWWQSQEENFRKSNYTDTGYGSWNRIIAQMSKMPESTDIGVEEHFYRNLLNIQFEWDDFKKLNEKLPDDLKWKELSPLESGFHKFGQLRNRKYVSACGHFEVVYTKEDYLVDEEFSAMNMGTYNYYGPDQVSEHTEADVKPWAKKGNTRKGWIWSGLFDLEVERND